MKKHLFPIVAGLGLAVSARAALVLDETFTYSAGALTAVSAGVWANHSGTASQVDVASGKVNLTQSETEDVNARLGGTYSTGNLYASFVVNFSGLPSGTGDYFAHFKDSGNGFRCRVFANTNGTDGTKFQVGITKGQGGTTPGTPVYIPVDLNLNTDHTLVIRYDTVSTASYLWVDPGSEGAIGANATDTIAATPITSFGLRQSLSSGNGMGTLTLDNLKVGTAFSDVVVGGNPALNPPFISSIADQSVPKNAATPAVPFYVIDGETVHGNLTLSATSTDMVLVPVNSIVFSPNNPGDSNRNVTITPAADQQGASEVTVTVTDSDNNIASDSFLVVVGAPTISAIADQTTPKDTTTPAITFNVSDTEGDTLTLTATSTTESVVPVSGIVFGSSGGSLSNITITPAAGVSGVTRIAVIVSDGFNTVSNRFLLNVFPTRGVDLCDTFTYADGSVVTNSDYFWNTHSATTGQIGQTHVAQGKLLIKGSQTEDIHAFLTNSPYMPSEGWLLYSRFQATFTASPTNDYFAHFRASSGSSFGARIFATTNGAAPGKLRIGIANSGALPSAVVPMDLETNVTYSVVSRLNVATAQSKVWVNPYSESDAGAAATDAAYTFDVYTYAFRQSTGIGSITIDDLKVGTSFWDVAEPKFLISASGDEVTLAWPVTAAGYNLCKKDTVTQANWDLVTDTPIVSNGNNVFIYNNTTGARFFELIKP